MIKKLTMRRITLASILLFILVLFTIFPKQPEYKLDLQNNQTVEYVSKNATHEIYLIDKDNYVARTSVILRTEKTESKARELLEILVIGGKRENSIPSGFRAIIPVDTKILTTELKDGILKVNFSKEFLDVNKENEEKMLEAIIYTITSIEDIKGLIIYVDNILLTTLPKTGVKLPTLLTREFGVNKYYDIVNTRNIVSTTVYYINKHDENYYYVPVTKVTNSEKEKIKLIIDELTGGPIYQSNLMSFLNSNTRLLNYSLQEKSMQLEFNSYIVDNIENNRILEEVKYSILLSINDNYLVEKVVFIVNNVEIEKSVIKTLE